MDSILTLNSKTLDLALTSSCFYLMIRSRQKGSGFMVAQAQVESNKNIKKPSANPQPTTVDKDPPNVPGNYTQPKSKPLDLGVYNFSDILNEDVKPYKYMIDGIFMEGLDTVFGGRWSIGKTIFIIQVAIALAVGKTFMGRTVERPYKVGFFDAENGLPIIQPRLKAQADDLKLSPQEIATLNQNFLYVDGENGKGWWGTKFNNDGFEKFKTFVKKHEIEVLIIDCFGKLYIGHEKDEHNMKMFIDHLRDLKKSCPSLSSIILLHHIIKPQGVTVSLLTNPYEYVSMLRGNGRLLDFMPGRLAIADETVDEEKHFVVNGMLRGGPVEPLILTRDKDEPFFKCPVGEGKEQMVYRIKTHFAGASKQSDLCEQLWNKYGKGGNSFTFSDAGKCAYEDAQGFGHNYSTATISKMLKDAEGKLIKKSLDGEYSFM